MRAMLGLFFISRSLPPLMMMMMMIAQADSELLTRIQRADTVLNTKEILPVIRAVSALQEAVRLLQACSNGASGGESQISRPPHRTAGCKVLPLAIRSHSTAFCSSRGTSRTSRRRFLAAPQTSALGKGPHWLSTDTPLLRS